MAGGDLHTRFVSTRLFDEGHFFNKFNILDLSSDTEKESRLSGALSISEEFLTKFTTGEEYRPMFSSRFPAKLLTTNLNWGDLILENHIMEEVEEIQTWIKHEKEILTNENLIKRIKPGYRALFYGPPGTGKSLTATLLGKAAKRPVYRVDISQLVSKYIGETGKNLANIFNQAENKNWILFFDEADALFGKRTETKDSHDRHSNQEIAYLLQRIESHPNIIILATNLKDNIDTAFARRFQSMVYFPVPSVEQRLRLWQDAFGEHFKLEDSLDLRDIAQKYEFKITPPTESAYNLEIISDRSSDWHKDQYLRHRTNYNMELIKENASEELVKNYHNILKILGSGNKLNCLELEFYNSNFYKIIDIHRN